MRHLVLLLLQSVHSASISGEEGELSLAVRRCLLSYTFYWPGGGPGAGSCYPALQPGPCGRGSWLVPVGGRPGVAECRPRPRHTLACHLEPVLVRDPATGELAAECGEVAGRQHEQLFTPAHCEAADQLLVPRNFAADTLPCPDTFVCSADYAAATARLRVAGNPLLGEETAWSRELVCSTEPRMVCVPPGPGQRSLFDEDMLYASLQPATAECRTNPCPAGRWPWLAEDGHYRCLASAEDSSSCYDSCVLTAAELASCLRRCLLASTQQLRRCPGSLVTTDTGALDCQLYTPEISGAGAEAACPHPRRQVYRCTGERCSCRPRFFG